MERIVNMCVCRGGGGRGAARGSWGRCLITPAEGVAGMCRGWCATCAACCAAPRCLHWQDGRPCCGLCHTCCSRVRTLAQKHEKARREKAGGQAVEEIDENFIRLYWEQMLQVSGHSLLAWAGRQLVPESYAACCAASPGPAIWIALKLCLPAVVPLLAPCGAPSCLSPPRSGRGHDPPRAHRALRPQARQLPGGGGAAEADRLWHRQGHPVGCALRLAWQRVKCPVASPPLGLCPPSAS